MELNIAFSCPCGAFVDQNLHVDMQESSTDTVSDRDEELYVSVQCNGCGKDFEAQITSKFGEVIVSIDGAVSLTFEVLAEDENDELRWIIESSEQINTYRDVLRHAYRLVEDLKGTLCNMIYAQMVTAVEAYRSGTFIRTVINSDALIRKLVMTDPALANRPLLLKGMFSRLEGLKLTVAKYLQDLIFHDLKKVKPMYASVLDIDFGDIGWLFRAVLIRHDCVHRNGVNMEGKPTDVDEPAIVELIKNCSPLVVDIDQQVQYSMHEAG